MKTPFYNMSEYISPTVEVYEARAEGVLCTSTSYFIINDGHLFEDEDVWEK
ncbi:MAG: hypothetical protein IJU69_06265 [Bacteroidales bacterium]|nr:hypothetical protein [Bacteroidales bacterium]